MKPKVRRIIGRREIVSFPDLDLLNIEAKIDTGAYGSALDCKEVKQFKENGQDYVSFIPLDQEHPSFEHKQIKWPVFRIKPVKNSSGQAEERVFIKTKLEFFDEIYEIEISLADRSMMDYPILLGRKILKKKFLVDVSKVHYAANRKIIEYK